MLKKMIYVFLAALFMQTGIVHAKEIEPIKNFDDVFVEAIGTHIDDIGYGMVCFPSEGINRAASLEQEDLRRLMELYSGADGECIIAPEGNYFYDYNTESATKDIRFYIGVSIKLPEERWTWHKNIKMLQLCFGGEYNGAAIYGGYGIIKSSYGDGYPSAMPVNFVWYKPVGEAANEIREAGKEIYNKYKSITKPFGDYDGTRDEQYFSGYDGTWDTKLILPQCFKAEGSSEWAYDTLQCAAAAGLVPYTISSKYTEPITRREFCEIVANLLNMVPSREYDDLFANPTGYSVLAEKAAEISGVKDISYADMEQTPESIKYLSSMGIIYGVGNNEFDPDGYITREQVCTILNRVFRLYPEFGITLEGEIGDSESVFYYSDNDRISSWAHDSVYAMTRYKIINGMEDNRFNPDGYCTLEQAITILSRISCVSGIKY